MAAVHHPGRWPGVPPREAADGHACRTLVDDRAVGRDHRGRGLGRGGPRARLVVPAEAGHVTATRPVRAVRAEWTKLRTLPSTGWLMLVVVLGTVGLGFAITGSLDFEHCGTPCPL